MDYIISFKVDLFLQRLYILIKPLSTLDNSGHAQRRNNGTHKRGVDTSQKGPILESATKRTYCVMTEFPLN